MPAAVVTLVSAWAVLAVLPQSNCATNTPTLVVCRCVSVRKLLVSFPERRGRLCSGPFLRLRSARFLPTCVNWRFLGKHLFSHGSAGAPFSLPVSHFRFSQNAALIGSVNIYITHPQHTHKHAHIHRVLIVCVCRLWSCRMLCFVAPLWSPSSFAFDNTDNPPTRSLIQSPTYTHTHTRTHSYTYTLPNIRTQTYTHTHSYTYIHAYMCVSIH